MGSFFFCFAIQFSAWTIAKNSPTLLVPSGYGPARNNSLPDSVSTPRYSILPGEPSQAASTLMDGRIGFSSTTFHFPREEDLPLYASYFDRNADSASLNEPNALNSAPTNP